MKVLQLSTYPIVYPIHGGQIRVSQIRDKLHALNCEVLSLSLSEPSYSAYHPLNDLVVNMSSYHNPYNSPYCNDLLSSQLCANVKHIYNYFENHIKTFKPNVVFLEQPWLWPVIRKMFTNGVMDRDKTYLVYSAQNIEYKMKELMLKKMKFKNDQISKPIIDIQNLEIDLILAADEVICVTKDDDDLCRSYNNKTNRILPNAVVKRSISSDTIEKFKTITSNNRFLFFAGSAHPPNAIGFWEMFGPSLANFPPDCTIAMAGGIHDIIFQNAPQEAEIFSMVNSKVIKTLGVVSEELLAMLIACSRGIILPITFGGGSNLKTAEAIASHKPVVATSVACRGFDFVNELSNFFIADDAHDFSTIAQRMVTEQLPLKEITQREKELRDSVYWDHALMGLGQVLENAKLKITELNHEKVCI